MFLSIKHNSKKVMQFDFKGAGLLHISDYTVEKAKNNQISSAFMSAVMISR